MSFEVRHIARDEIQREDYFCSMSGMKGRNASTYAISILFANGDVGSLALTDCRTYQQPTEEVEISVSGSNSMTIHNSSSWRITENGEPNGWREPPTAVAAGDSGRDTGHMAEIADFFAALREGRTTRSNISESYRSMILYDAIAASASTGAVVDVAYEAT